MTKRAVQAKVPVRSDAVPAAHDEKWVALHPMHQRLVLEFDQTGVDAERLSPAARLGAIFYLGLAGWAAVGGTVWTLSRVL